MQNNPIIGRALYVLPAAHRGGTMGQFIGRPHYPSDLPHLQAIVARFNPRRGGAGGAVRPVTADTKKADIERAMVTAASVRIRLVIDGDAAIRASRASSV